MENEQIPQATLFAKMARVMAGVSRMPKTGVNKHFGYAFVKDSDVLDTIRALMVEQNLAMFPEIVSYEADGKKTKIQMVFTIACGDTGATRSMSWFGEADDSQDKGIGKAATLAEKYFLLKLFLVSTGDEKDDPDSGVDGKPQQKSQPRQNAPKTPLNQSQGDNGVQPQAKAQNGANKGVARQNAIAAIIRAGCDPVQAQKIEPPPSNRDSELDNQAWAERVIQRMQVSA